MTGDTEVEVPVVVDNKIEDVVKSDKEVIAEEEKELLEKENEKTDEPEKTEEDKQEDKQEEEVTEPKKLNLLQKLFGKRKDYVVPTIDEVAKTDKEVFQETEKADDDKAEKSDEEKPEKADDEKAEKTDEEKAEKTDEEKADDEKTEKSDEEKKEEPTKVQSKLKKIFSMKKTKKEVAEKAEKPEGEDKIEEGDEEKKDQEKNEEENTTEVKEGEDAIEEVAEADMSTTTAEKKTLMQKLMTIKRDLMANKKEDTKVEEDKKEEEEKKEGEEEETVEEKKEGEAEVKVEGEEATEDDTKDELGNDKTKPNNRIKKFFSMKRDSKPILTKEAVEEAEKEDNADGAENIEKTEKVNLLQRLFGRKEKVEKDTEAKDDGETVEAEKKEEDTTEVKVEDTAEKIIMVHLVNRTPAIPSIDPMQLKLESWLKFHQIKYENTHNKDNLPASAYLPMQSNDYLSELANTHNKQMPMELDADQKSTQHAMMTLVEKNIHFAILSWQCSNVDNLIKGYKINLQTYLNSKVPLALLRLFFKNNFCKSGIKLVKTNGFADNNTEEIEKLAKDDLKVLAEMLGDKEFFFGASASLLDLVVFSHLSQITVVDDSVTCTLRDHIKTEHENLFNLVDRMKTLIWGEDWVAATEQLELNPHIPKPVVEEVKEEVKEEVVEEVVEKASEEKVEEVVEVVEEKVEETAEAVKVDNAVTDNKFEEEVADKVEEVSQTAETNEDTEAKAE